jgi:hypothetical protein
MKLDDGIAPKSKSKSKKKKKRQAKEEIKTHKALSEKQRGRIRRLKHAIRERLHMIPPESEDEESLQHQRENEQPE